MKKYRILIVDDIPGTIEALAVVLSPDYELSIATNGPDALKIVESEPPDLILLDIVMPGMDGFEVCAQLKTNEATRDIPVIFITAKTANEDIVKGLEAGAYYYLTKPFDSQTMLAVTTAALSEYASLIALRQEVRRTSHTLSLLDEGRF
ncbi:MAG: response regulator, partial [Magnetococcales bacterium]|nr:response regulator [Magnetococcales bacterium]